MNSYIKEIIYTSIISVSMIICGICILTSHNTMALFMLLITGVFILFELYSLFLRLENNDVIDNNTSSHTLNSSTSNNFTFEDGIDAVSEPIVRKPSGFKKRH